MTLLEQQLEALVPREEPDPNMPLVYQCLIGITVPPAPPRTSKCGRQIMAALDRRPRATLADLAREVPFSRVVIATHLKRLVDAGRAIRVPVVINGRECAGYEIARTDR